jgi:hypothetical protein
MICRIFIALIVIIAVIVGVLALCVNHEDLIRLTRFRDFFDVALPILGFGALVKYMCSCSSRCCCGDKACPPPKM